jgi:hypothetical protein
MNTLNHAKKLLSLFLLLFLLSGCTGGSSTSEAPIIELDGIATSRAIYFSPLTPAIEEPVLADETISLDVDGEIVAVTTNTQGQFRLRLRNGSGDCNAGNGGLQKRYGGNGKYGAGERINWNFVDNDGDGICDNTLEVILN